LKAIASGVAINVTLLFSREQYQASADAYLRGLERRVSAGLNPDIRSVASVFVSRWDKATMDKVPGSLRDKLGIAIGQQIYKAYRDLLASDRWQRLANFGARPQRLLFASTGTKDPKASDVLYIDALAAPNTINTMPEETLIAFSEHGQLGGALPRNGGSCEQVLADFGRAGIDLGKLAEDGYWGATEQKTRLRIQVTSTIESGGLRSGRNRGMATTRDRLGHMFATQRLGWIQYLLIKGNLRPVCWPWPRRSSTASQRAASAARGSDRTYP
jgi:hypothetical protein